MMDADAVINNSSQKVGGSNAYGDAAPKNVRGSGPRKTHRIYAPASCCVLSLLFFCVLSYSIIFTARCHASAVLAMSLCLSVCLCLSVTSRSFTKTAKRRITQTTPHDSTGTLVSETKDLREIRPGSPLTGTPNAGGVGQNRRLSTNNRLYLENGTRQTHGFY